MLSHAFPKSSCRVAVIIVVFAASGFGQELRGFVHTANGDPIAGATVYPSGMMWTEKTDKEGKFLLDAERFRYWFHGDKKHIIFFGHKGYEPKVVIVNAGTADVDVLLESEVTVARSPIELCPEKPPKNYRFSGDRLRVLYPKRMKTKRQAGDHGIGFQIFLDKRDEDSTLNISHSLHATRFPPSHLILGSKNYSVLRTDVGLDWRGETVNGKHWRYAASAAFDIFFYQTGSVAAMAEFDTIMETFCIAPWK